MILSYRVVDRLLRLVPAETGHRAAIVALRCGLVPAHGGDDDPVLASTVWGRRLANPVGLAAGFDKHAEAVVPAGRLGFAFVEIGSVTPRPQPGNPKPRLFRLAEDRGVINRYGFNSHGLDAVCARLRELRRRHPALSLVVGGNLAQNRDSADVAQDYVAGVCAMAGLVDYLVINISSPNTRGLRAMQARDALAALLARVREARHGAARTGPEGHAPAKLVVKIAPDLEMDEREGIAETVLAGGVDGLIIGNSTTTRPEALRSPHRDEVGGLTGRPLFALSTEVLGTMYRLTGGRIPLVGCGGVEDGATAYAKIRAGASLIQLYTALVYEGPGVVARIKAELAARLRADAFDNLTDAVGADHRAGTVSEGNR